MNQLAEREDFLPTVQGATPATASLIERTLERAAAVDAPIRFIGVQRAFGREIRAYRGQDRDWIFGPLRLDPVYREFGGKLPVPEASLSVLRRLRDAGLKFPALYSAHDIPKGALQAAYEQTTGRELVPLGGQATVSAEVARRVISLPGPHRTTIERSRRYGMAAEVIMRGVMLAAGAAAAVALSPLVVAGSAFAGVGAATGLGDVGIDPILFGAVPLRGPVREGTPAVWFVLTEWDY